MSWLLILNLNHTTSSKLKWSLATIFFIYTLSKWIKMKRHFKKINLKPVTPIPFIGSLLIFSVLRPRKKYNDISKSNRTTGFFVGSTPFISTRDPNIIKAVTIKNFSHFVNRNSIEAFKKTDFNDSLLFLENDKWKNVRSIVSTAFTTGKLKSMSKHIDKCSDNLIEYIEELVKNDEYIDCKKLFGILTLDAISSFCFGIEANSAKENDNPLLKNLELIASNNQSFGFKFALFIAFLSPKLADILAYFNLISFVSKEMKVIKKLSNEIIERRRSKLEKRDDFVQMMIEYEQNLNENLNQIENIAENIESKSRRIKNLSNSEIIAQSVLLMIAGYDTTSNALQFISYKLALNPEYQKTLIDEVDKYLEESNYEINYQTVSKMKYMDMIINETLRLYPPAFLIDRVCNEPCEIEHMNIPKGQIVSIRIVDLHYDPEFYPNPEKFVPERFNEENKKKIPNEAFIPFGSGPRNCVAMRFAILEIKLVLAKLLSKYQFVKCDKTTESYQIGVFQAATTEKIIIKMKNRF